MPPGIINTNETYSKLLSSIMCIVAAGDTGIGETGLVVYKDKLLQMSSAKIAHAHRVTIDSS